MFTKTTSFEILHNAENSWMRAMVLDLTSPIFGLKIIGNVTWYHVDG